MGLMGVTGFRLAFDGRWPFDCLMLACLGLLYVLYLSLFVEFRLMYLQYSLHLICPSCLYSIFVSFPYCICCVCLFCLWDT